MWWFFGPWDKVQAETYQRKPSCASSQDFFLTRSLLLIQYRLIAMKKKLPSILAPLLFYPTGDHDPASVQKHFRADHRLTLPGDLETRPADHWFRDPGGWLGTYYYWPHSRAWGTTYSLSKTKCCYFTWKMWSNLWIRGNSEAIKDLPSFTTALFHELSLSIPIDLLEFDRIHQALTRCQPDGPPHDIMVKLHFYCTKEQLLADACSSDMLQFQGNTYPNFLDLALVMVAKRWPWTHGYRSSCNNKLSFLGDLYLPYKSPTAENIPAPLQKLCRPCWKIYS